MTDSSHKRAPRVFEPPPWERDAFEELSRKREAQEAADRELAEATARLRAAEAAKAKAAAAGDDPVVAKARMLAEAELARTKGEGGGAAEAIEVEAPAEVKPPEAAIPAVDGEVPRGPAEAEVELMLARLSLEEPKAHATHDLTVWAGVLLVALGIGMLVMSIWWQRAGADSGAAMAQLLVQSLLVGGFGLGFAVLGGVIVYQSRLQARS